MPNIKGDTETSCNANFQMSCTNDFYYIPEALTSTFRTIFLCSKNCFEYSTIDLTNQLVLLLLI